MDPEDAEFLFRDWGKVLLNAVVTDLGEESYHEVRAVVSLQEGFKQYAVVSSVFPRGRRWPQ